MRLKQGGTYSNHCDIKVLAKRACIFFSGGIFILAVLNYFQISMRDPMNVYSVNITETKRQNMGQHTVKLAVGTNCGSRKDTEI